MQAVDIVSKLLSRRFMQFRILGLADEGYGLDPLGGNEKEDASFSG